MRTEMLVECREEGNAVVHVVRAARLADAVHAPARDTDIHRPDTGERCDGRTDGGPTRAVVADHKLLGLRDPRHSRELTNYEARRRRCRITLSHVQPIATISIAR